MQIQHQKNDTLEKDFIQFFDLQHSHFTKIQFEKVVETILKYRNVYATTKFDVGKTKVKVNLPMSKDAYSKNNVSEQYQFTFAKKYQNYSMFLKNAIL